LILFFVFTYFLSSFVIFYVFFSIRISWSHDLNNKFDGLTWVDLLFIPGVIGFIMLTWITQTFSLFFFYPIFVLPYGLRIDLHSLTWIFLRNRIAPSSFLILISVFFLLSIWFLVHILSTVPVPTEAPINSFKTSMKPWDHEVILTDHNTWVFFFA
jgi:hypothetical protein